MNKSSQQWIEAAKAFSKNPKASFKCPECDTGYLISKDEISDDESKIDKYLICDSCGKWNVITIAASSQGPDIK